MRLLFLLGRLLFGGFFLYNGVNHFINHGMSLSSAEPGEGSGDLRHVA